MDKIEKIRNRINGIEEKETNNIFLTIGNIFLIVCLVGVGALTYFKVDEDASLINNVFDTDISFKEVNNVIKGALNEIFNIDNENNDVVVSSEQQYISVGNNNYKTDDNRVHMLLDGIVTYVNYQNEYKYFVIVSYINGVDALYTYVDNCELKINDRLSMDETIGNYEGEYFNCIFKKGDKIITYNDAF